MTIYLSHGLGRSCVNVASRNAHNVQVQNPCAQDGTGGNPVFHDMLIACPMLILASTQTYVLSARYILKHGHDRKTHPAASSAEAQDLPHVLKGSWAAFTAQLIFLPRPFGSSAFPRVPVFSRRSAPDYRQATQARPARRGYYDIITTIARCAQSRLSP